MRSTLRLAILALMCLLLVVPMVAFAADAPTLAHTAPGTWIAAEEDPEPAELIEEAAEDEASEPLFVNVGVIVVLLGFGAIMALGITMIGRSNQSGDDD